MQSFARRCFVVAALSGLELARQAASALAEDMVRFDSAAARLHQAEEPRDRDAPDGARSKADIRGYLTKPKGAGPFPAVVLLHSCLGLPANRRSIAGSLAGWGYVALFVDDFTTRGVKETCAVEFREGVPDAYGALVYLSRLPYVDPARIAAVGYSQGADAALEIASSRFASAFAIRGALKFKVAAAFYPPCENQANVELRIPTLILVGEADSVTPAADCERLEKAQPRDRSQVKLVKYPGASHGFDNPEFAEGRRIFAMWLQYDRDAAERSNVALRDFLATKLAR